MTQPASLMSFLFLKKKKKTEREKEKKKEGRKERKKEEKKERKERDKSVGVIVSFLNILPTHL